LVIIPQPDKISNLKKKERRKSEWGEEVRQEKQYIIGKYEIEFPVFTYHYK
jgi:hypothetical protein